jgi:hypothetical protein
MSIGIAAGYAGVAVGLGGTLATYALSGGRERDDGQPARSSSRFLAQASLPAAGALVGGLGALLAWSGAGIGRPVGIFGAFVAGSSLAAMVGASMLTDFANDPLSLD